MTLTTTQSNIIKTAVSLGILQSVTWVILSIICIVLYLKSEIPSLLIEDYQEYLQYVLYMMYIYKDRPDVDLQVVTPKAFFAFMWVYLIFNVLWFGSSVALFIVMRNHSDKKKRVGHCLRIWWGMAAFNLFLDLIFTTMLGSDSIGTCDVAFVSVEAMLASAMCYNATYVAMVIAGKGFVLLIVNAVFMMMTKNLAIDLREMHLSEERSY